MIYKLSGIVMALLTGAAELVIEDGVIVLDESNFEEELPKYENLLVEFYSPGW